MKKWIRLLPVLIAVLLIAVLLLPSDPGGTARTDTADQTVQENLALLPDDTGDDAGAPPQAVAVSSGKSGKTSEKSSPAPSARAEEQNAASELERRKEALPEDGSYCSKEDVLEYLILYGHLPDNYVTKNEARDAGWSGGSVEQVLPGMCIGGDRFGNYEGLLPKAKGRTWYECDINTLGKRSRGAERILFSSDGLIYYTDDHYNSYTLLYGEP